MKRKYPRDVKYLEEDFELEQGVAIERNGNLTLVEKKDGTVDWYCPSELQEDY